MRNRLALVLVVLVVLGAWWWTRPAPSAVEAAVAATTPAQPAAEAAERRTRLDDGEPERARRLRDGAARREVMQRRIVTAMAARDAAAAASRTPADPEPTRPGKSGARAADDAPADAILDRTGNHGYLSRVLSRELMPLVDECHALVREEHPELTGMLVLDLEILGDEDIGGVVNTLEPGKGNEIAEPALLECVRESLLAVTLPPPEQGGRDAISLSMRFDPPKPE
ncbi:hypothetical protein SAMN02745121_02251 [Nannocystis exedens]|uniref:Uncharacterized protein n=1 Tax=Nannocystis exedens TaxID=54 RepID=A0A1I1WCB2_9BACT|nr:hypothetical protein [Nannocystis exedens]PCC67616.1 hypothetical protein NAEX_00623 [Nannocystis exedens]SFD92835.1 hypothetical protein SAMN02745121_02251 [Nannocystis exedens]